MTARFPVLTGVTLRILLALGFLLIAGGQFIIARHDAIAPLLAAPQPTIGVLAAFPTVVAWALGVLLLGALLVAIAIGVPPSPETRRSASIPPLVTRPRRRAAAASIVVALALACLTAWYSMAPQPPPGTTAGWLAAILAAVPGLLLLDRARGTRCGNPCLNRWEAISLAVIVGLTLLLVAHDLTHWRWSGIPDESDFFAVAKSIATGRSDRSLLSERGAFEVHPVLSSYYQSVFMRLFGINIFAWRLSSAVAFAASLPFVYLLARELWNRRTGYVAILLFAPAQLAVSFAHFGYNNVQAYPLVLGALGVCAWANRRGSLLAYYLAGCLAGLGFYTFYAARLAPLLVLWLAVSVPGSPLVKRDRGRTLALALGLVITTLPVWVRLDELLAHMAQFTSVTGGQRLAPSELGTVLDWFAASANRSRMLQHWLLALAYGVWFPGPHHFQANPIVDPISVAFAAVGCWLGVLGLYRRANIRFLLVAYLVSALLVGATSNDYRPPLTRLFVLAPFTALLAAVALDQLLRRMAESARPRAAGMLGVTCVAVAIAWNVGALRYNVYHRYHGDESGRTSELIRLVQQLPDTSRIISVQAEDTNSADVDDVLDEYGMRERLTYLRPFTASDAATLASLSPPVIVFYELRDPEHVRLVETTLTRRFPGRRWQDSDPGRPWNVRYFAVPENSERSKARSEKPESSGFQLGPVQADCGVVERGERRHVRRHISEHRLG